MSNILDFTLVGENDEQVNLCLRVRPYLDGTNHALEAFVDGPGTISAHKWIMRLLPPALWDLWQNEGGYAFWPDEDERENLEAAGAILPEHITGTLRLPLAKGGFVYVQIGEPPKQTSRFTSLSCGLWELTAEGFICVSPLTMARVIWPDGSGHIAALDEQGAVKDYPPCFMDWAKGINAIALDLRGAASPMLDEFIKWADYEVSEDIWALKFAPKKAID